MSRRYRYYVCHRATKRGRSQCPSPTLPANEIEQFFVNEIVAIGRDPDLRQRVLAEAQQRLVGDVNDKRKVRLDMDAASQALNTFEPLWQALSPAERRRLIRLLVERVVFDAANARVAITFQPTGIATLGAPEEAPDGPRTTDGAQLDSNVEEAAA